MSSRPSPPCSRSRAYEAARLATIVLTLSTYLAYTLAVALAHHAGGWLVVSVDRFGEGLFEAALLLAALPLVVYVSAREALASMAALARRPRRPP